MNLRLKTLAASALVSIILAATLSADTVELTKNATVKAAGGQIKGAISSETSTEVKIGDRSVPIEDIASVSYDGSTASYALATTRENGGNLVEAADLYKKAVTEAAGKPLLARAAAFGHAHALAELALVTPSRANEAMAAIDTFIRANPNSRQLAPALEIQSKLALQQDNIPRAEAALADLGKIPWAADRASILKARVLGKQKKYDQAISDLDKIISAAPAKSTKLIEAKMAKAENLAGLKKFSEAEKLILDVIKEVGPEDAPDASPERTTRWAIASAQRDVPRMRSLNTCRPIFCLIATRNNIKGHSLRSRRSGATSNKTGAPTKRWKSSSSCIPTARMCHSHEVSRLAPFTGLCRAAVLGPAFPPGEPGHFATDFPSGVITRISLNPSALSVGSTDLRSPTTRIARSLRSTTASIALAMSSRVTFWRFDRYVSR